MSEFDEEAERERLREKYERDQEKRATTQRMSELLLKGATMTNSHCGTCGDPIFRHDGREFCPTCQAADQGGEDRVAAEAETDHTERSDASSADTPETAARDRRPSPSDVDEPPTAASGDARVRDPVEGAETPRSPSSRPAHDGSLDDARASLSRTLVRYARAAEETDDPRRARELLAAAREAAETLAALDRR